MALVYIKMKLDSIDLNALSDWMGNMTFKVEECNDSDMQRAFAIISTAFGHEQPYIDHVFPEHEKPEGRRIGGERMLETKRNDPNTIFLKATEVESEKIVGVAKWNIFNGDVPPETDVDGDYWETEDEKECAQYLAREFLSRRRAAVRKSGGHLCSLDILTVDPKEQKRGSGRLLVKWGTQKADELGFDAVVEASDHGRHLYEQEGFQAIEKVIIELPQQWAGRPEQKFMWMIRPTKHDSRLT